jgi:hypothetical protein
MTASRWDKAWTAAGKAMVTLKKAGFASIPFAERDRLDPFRVWWSAKFCNGHVVTSTAALSALARKQRPGRPRGFGSYRKVFEVSGDGRRPD